MNAPTSQSGRTRRSMPIAAPQAVEVARKVERVSSWTRRPPKLLTHTVIGAGFIQSAAGAFGKGPALAFSGAEAIAIIEPPAEGAPLRRLCTSEDAPPVKSIKVRSV